MEIVCKYCKKVFVADNKSRNYCSTSCGLKHRAQKNHNKYYEDRLCPICNKKFHIRIKSKKKTCSRKCGVLASKNLKIKNEIRICAFCGKEFVVKPSKKQNTCSHICASKKMWENSENIEERRKTSSIWMKKIGKNNKGKDPWNKGQRGKQEAWNKQERYIFKCKICHRDYESYFKNGNARRSTCGSIYCKQAKVPLPIDHNIDVDNWIEPVKKLRCKICAKEFEVQLGRSGRIKGWKQKRGKGKKKLYTCSEDCFNVLRSKLLIQIEGKGCDTEPELEMEFFLKENKIRHQKQYWQRDGKRIFFYDFILWDYNILLEVDGDYWHANPKFYTTMNESQKKTVANDKHKERLAKERGFVIFRAWQSELKERQLDLLNLIRALEKGK